MQGSTYGTLQTPMPWPRDEPVAVCGLTPRGQGAILTVASFACIVLSGVSIVASILATALVWLHADLTTAPLYHGAVLCAAAGWPSLVQWHAALAGLAFDLPPPTRAPWSSLALEAAVGVAAAVVSTAGLEAIAVFRAIVGDFESPAGIVLGILLAAATVLWVGVFLGTHIMLHTLLEPSEARARRLRVAAVVAAPVVDNEALLAVA